ncbi:MAG TPA: hypothetical protein VEA99_13580, partial [Gemmatimonadaceae bacterium]|nr:hypothetical protein [Gemmatimonadaceae bacterium]
STTAGAPAAGMRVQLAGSDFGAVTDSTGVALLADLLPGPYRVAIADPRLDAIDWMIPTSLQVIAVRDSVVEARPVAETAEEHVRRRCERDGTRVGGSVLIGRVLAADGTPVGGARWTIRNRTGELLAERGESGDDGLFHWCALPLGEPVTVDVERAGRYTTQSVVVRPLTVVRLEFTR